MAAQKKHLVASERDEAARAAWRAAAAALAPTDLVFLDETSTHIALTRLRARAPRGQRAAGQAPRNRGRTLTLVAALTPEGIGPSVVVEGAADAAVVAASVERFLAPRLRPGQVVVLDNLSAHTGARARALVEAAGRGLRFLPPSSPDFNPIGLAFSQLTVDLRRAGARAYEPLVAAIGQGLAAVTPAHARAYFTHCGFPLRDRLL